MRPSTCPTIKNSNLAAVILYLKNANVTNLLSLKFVDSPAVESLLEALCELKDLQFLDGPSGDITIDGRRAARLPIDQIWYRVLEAGNSLGCLEDICAIVAISCSQYPIWTRPIAFQDAADMMDRCQFAHPLFDHITDLNALHAYGRVKAEGKIDLPAWCHDHFLSQSTLEHIMKSRRGLAEKCQRVFQALAKGLVTQSAMLKKGHTLHVTVQHNQPGLIHPESCVIYAGKKVDAHIKGDAFPAYEWIV
ncbi:uncharacterized protein JN550_005676 [Neoarthrinium moseri]|uniref:uncharacterized protein n=1 Tax=Neoarthrinium moseri TaxID=1658444 RepID=UPI001FDC8691|nr:uncharacterized protein JN550_005676 [Neoarthrinium moseri]KAI1869695.1 hypothetical protein JN550_005676 [Neoarthrinium moseri]